MDETDSVNTLIAKVKKYQQTLNSLDDESKELLFNNKKPSPAQINGFAVRLALRE